MGLARRCCPDRPDAGHAQRVGAAGKAEGGIGKDLTDGQVIEAVSQLGEGVELWRREGRYSSQEQPGAHAPSQNSHPTLKWLSSSSATVAAAHASRQRTATLRMDYSMPAGMDGPREFQIQLRTNHPANPEQTLVAKSDWGP